MSISCSNQREHYSMERRPKMLKDFLIDDSYSCSSSGFKSYPCRIDLDGAREASKGLQRSRSKAASVTISAFQALINSVKSIQFTAIKSPSILPRSLSRRLSKRNIHHAQNHSTNTSTTSHEGKMITTVKIKDIIRWKSFRDLVDEKAQSQPFDHHLVSSPDHHHITTSCSSNASSWCDSDFTSEYLPSCSGNQEEYSENDVEVGKKYLPCVGRASVEPTIESPTVGPKDDLTCDQKQQRSPISILDYNDRFKDDSLLSFDRTLVTMERTRQKLMQNFRRFESLAQIDSINLDEWILSMENNNGYEDDDSDYDEEEDDEVEQKAKLLMNHVKATSCMENSELDSTISEQMLLDFFVEELSTKRNQIRNVEADIDQMVSLAKTWIHGEQSGAMELEKCVEEMDRKDGWNKFEEEQEEIGLQIENGLLSYLLDELLADVILR